MGEKTSCKSKVCIMTKSSSAHQTQQIKDMPRAFIESKKTLLRVFPGAEPFHLKTTLSF